MSGVLSEDGKQQQHLVDALSQMVNYRRKVVSFFLTLKYFAVEKFHCDSNILTKLSVFLGLEKGEGPAKLSPMPAQK